MMKQYPHKPRSHMPELRKNNRLRYEQSLAMIPEAEASRNSGPFKYACFEAIQIASLEYAFDEPLADVKALLATACSYANKAIDLGLELHSAVITVSPCYLLLLGLANLCAQGVFRSRLEGMERSQYTKETIREDEVHFLVAEIAGDLSAGRQESARERLKAAQARLADKKLKPPFRQWAAPLLAMAEAIFSKDHVALDKAVQAEAEQYCKEYSSSEGKNDPMGLLDVVGLGFLKIADGCSLSPAPEAGVFLANG